MIARSSRRGPGRKAAWFIEESHSRMERLLDFSLENAQVIDASFPEKVGVLTSVEKGGLRVALMREPPPPKRALTPREKDVMALVGFGLGNAGIARVLGTSERTVEGHVQSLFDKLGINSRAMLARYAIYLLGEPHAAKSPRSKDKAARK